MDLRQLAAFVAVAEQLHFGRAAKQMHMTQPPLSRHIQRLEHDLGAQLVVRSGHRVELTAVGGAFLIEARAVLARADEAARTAQRVARGEIGRLRVGHVDSASSKLLPAALGAFHDRSPDVHLLLHESRSAPLLQALCRHDLDVAFVRPPGHDDRLVSEVLAEEPLVVAMAASHPLAAQEAVALPALADEPFILAPRHEDALLHDKVIACCERGGFRPSLAAEAFPLSSVVLFVAAGLGVSIVPAFVSSHLCQHNVVYRPMEDAPEALQLSLSWRSDETSPAVHAFAEVARKVAATL